jgi:chondroitin 4-sulfotransferase 11
MENNNKGKLSNGVGYTSEMSFIDRQFKKPLSGKKFLYIHIPKCAGTSVVKSLKSYICVNRIGPHEKGKFIFSANGVGLKRDDYYVMSFVRNPWERLVSSFFYFIQGDIGYPIDRKTWMMEKYKGCFEQFILDIDYWFNFIEEDSIYEDKFVPHFRPQLEYISDENGNCLCDFIGKQETLNVDFLQLSALLNISNNSLLHINQSNHWDFTRYYTKRTRDIVMEYFQKDIEALGYKSFSCADKPRVEIISNLKRQFVYNKFIYKKLFSKIYRKFHTE